MQHLFLLSVKHPKHYFAAVASFIIWGFISFGLKPIQNYPATDILFYRVFFCVGLMVLINLVFRRDVIKKTISGIVQMTGKQKQNFAFITLGSGLLLMSNWFLFIFVMNSISVKAASFAYLVCPILTTVFAAVILKEKLTGLQWFAVFLSVVSCVLLSLNAGTEVFYSLLVASTYALYLIVQKKNTLPDKFLGLTLQVTFACILLLPFYPYYTGSLPAEGTFYMYILLMAVLFTIIPLFLNVYALKHINSSTVGILLYINPIIAFLLAIFYYSEQVSIFQLMAYSIIILSIIIFNLKVLTPRKNNPAS